MKAVGVGAVTISDARISSVSNISISPWSLDRHLVDNAASSESLQSQERRC